MIIQKFNGKNGISVFRESNLVTQLHAHPALELLFAQEGHFTLITGNKRLENIRFALVKPNQWHAYQGEHCNCEFIFVEPEFAILPDILAAIGQTENADGILAMKETSAALLTIDALQQWCSDSLHRATYDPRILTCMNFIQNHIDENNLLLAQLAQQIQLSPSRLSHLFKAQIGLPIQKYIIWTRLKVTIDLVLRENKNLTEAALSAGFYDSAHFSKHFKEMLGVKPSLVYNNSRIVQGLD